MSPIAEMDRFSLDVAADASLRKNLEASGTELGAVVAFANARGYAFTVEEVKAHAAGEIAEEALGTVVGGAKADLSNLIAAKADLAIISRDLTTQQINIGTIQVTWVP